MDLGGGNDFQRSEFAILGCVLKKTDLVPVLMSLIPDEQAFVDDVARGLFVAVRGVFMAGGPKALNPTTVAAKARELGVMEQFGPEADELTILTAWVEAEGALPALLPEGLQEACGVLQRRLTGQRLYETCMSYAVKAKRTDANPVTLLSEMQTALIDLLRVNTNLDDRIVPLDQALIEVLDDLARIRDSGNPITGRKTGYAEIDKQIGGLQDGTLTLLGGKMKDGKSAISLQMALNVCLIENLPVLYFTCEMRPKKLAERYITQAFGVPFQSLKWKTTDKVGGLSYPVWDDALRNASQGKLPGKYLERIGNLIMVNASKMTVQEIEGVVRHVNFRLEQAGRHGAALVVVDYLQLLTPRQSPVYRNRPDLMWADMGQDLRDGIAGPCEVPVLALTQLSDQGRASGSKLLEAHCDSFWHIIRQVPEEEYGMLYMPLNRDAPSKIAYKMMWLPDSLTYKLVDEIHEDPEAILARVAGDGNSRYNKGNGGGGNGNGGNGGGRTHLDRSERREVPLKPNHASLRDEVFGPGGEE